MRYNYFYEEGEIMDENVNSFYKMPKKVWDILVAIMLVIAIAAVICECVFYFVYVKKPIRLAIGIVGIMSAFFMVLLLVYSYLPKVKKIWEEQKIQIMLQDPRNADLIAKYTSQNSQDEISEYEETIEEKDLK